MQSRPCTYQSVGFVHTGDRLLPVIRIRDLEEILNKFLTAARFFEPLLTLLGSSTKLLDILSRLSGGLFLCFFEVEADSPFKYPVYEETNKINMIYSF